MSVSREWYALHDPGRDCWQVVRLLDPERGTLEVARSDCRTFLQAQREANIINRSEAEETA